MINHLLVRFPVVSKASKMSDDEIDVRILRGEHVYDLWTANDVHEYRKPKPPGGFTHLARGHAFKSMNLDAPKTPPRYGMLYHAEYFAGIAFCVHKNKPNESPGITADNAGDLLIGQLIIAVKGREHNRLVDSGCLGAA